MRAQVTRRAGIVGGGSIGIAFAVVFARAGWQVRLFDPAADRREARVAWRDRALMKLAQYRKESVSNDY
jgi:2-polyprenyl-6-methoxyphenol hydroxylase-like FAD-dependent oxidoreductase